MQVPVYNLAGEVVENIDISDEVFAIPFNQAVVHQAMVRQQANARHGTASTKTRSEVSGSTRKLFRQKGTGRARRGNIKSPLLRGGGVTFGPGENNYKLKVPKKQIGKLHQILRTSITTQALWLPIELFLTSKAMITARPSPTSRSRRIARPSIGIIWSFCLILNFEN